MMSAALEAMRAARQVVFAAERNMESVIKANLPVGATIIYEITRLGDTHRICAEVLGHSANGIRVRGKSGAEYWVGGYRVVRVTRKPKGGAR